MIIRPMVTISSNTSSGNVPAQNCRPSRKKETAPRAAKTRLKVDKVIVHEIEDYYQLPDGARLMKRNGMADVWEYRFIEHVRAHNVEHVYKVARVKLADGTFTNTMEHPLKNLGGIFSPDLLARLLCLKYDFSMPENRQIRLLAREGIHISNTTLNSYIHNGISDLGSLWKMSSRSLYNRQNTLWLTRRPSLSELKHRKARLTGESIYGLFCKACQVGLLSLQ